MIFYRWTCGTKYFLSKLSADGIKTKSADICEEIHKSGQEEIEEKLENDSDLFDEVDSSKSKWKFIGDCAFLLNETSGETEPVDNTRTASRKRSV